MRTRIVVTKHKLFAKAKHFARELRFQHGAKNLPIPFGLLLCGLILVAIDVACHGMALYRLEHQQVDLSRWRYRVVDRAAESPENLGLIYESRSRFTLWRQHLIARPDLVIVTNQKLDPSMTWDLAVTRMADLCLQDCTGLTPAVMTEISGIDFHRLTSSTATERQPLRGHHPARRLSRSADPCADAPTTVDEAGSERRLCGAIAVGTKVRRCHTGPDHLPSPCQ